MVVYEFDGGKINYENSQLTVLWTANCTLKISILQLLQFQILLSFCVIVSYNFTRSAKV